MILCFLYEIIDRYVETVKEKVFLLEINHI